MKFLNIFVIIMSVFAMLSNISEAAPKGVGSALKTGLRVIGAAGTAHDVYEHIKHRNHG
ncbi:hypothetical protein O3G_MSEX006804 [Manduca sexta]|uniref:Uncharacterized protein n=1 Tax=Manduca sexta TaxID=7130 RepID=A0A921Z459_MANSE|nr:hypothetical protein O3G_MSEX006804 [Manduca sexta]KAG6450803.1 hypothetical protein O3G_MSEX006804 [Manduca sexta]